MFGQKIPPRDFAARVGADETLVPTFEFASGVDLTGWSANLVVFREDEGELLNVNVLLSLGATPNIGTAAFTIAHSVTSQFVAGRRQGYYVKLTSPGSWSEIFLYGKIDGYVVPGVR